MKINRRKFLGTTAALGASAYLTGCSTAQPDQATKIATPFFIGNPEKVLMSKGKAPRIVVAGGGWGGTVTAKYLRKMSPQAEVVLLERNPVFFSCPISNKWLVDMVDTNFLIQDYLQVSQKYGYQFIQCEILNINRESRNVVTSQGLHSQ